MENEILSVILQAGSGAAPLIALYLYHKSIQQILSVLVGTMVDNQRLTSVLLETKDDKETLRSLLITGVETYGIARTSGPRGQDRPTQERDHGLNGQDPK